MKLRKGKNFNLNTSCFLFINLKNIDNYFEVFFLFPGIELSTLNFFLMCLII